jgi:hypothetical protein
MTVELTWHQALAYAVSGCRLTDLGLQTAPDVAALAAELHARLEHGDLALVDPPTDVPANLMKGLGAAQFWSALAELRRDLARTPVQGPVISSRPLTPDERRLHDDRPPHHGG